MSKKNYIVVFLFSLYLANGLYSLGRQSLIYDEQDHLRFGVHLLKGNVQRYNIGLYSKMPVSVLNTLPRIFEQLLHPGLKKTDNGDEDVFHGRYITFLVSLLIGVYVLKWSTELYGEKAGLFSLFLFVFCPNCLAQAVLVTTDTYSVLLLLTVMYYLWRWLNYGSNRDFLIFCVLTGVAQLAKQQLFHLYVIIPCLLLLYFFAQENRVFSWRRVAKKMAIFAGIQLLVINAGFYFQGFGTPLAAYHFMSHLFQGLQQHTSFVARLPFPLPFGFVDGLDKAKHLDDLGGGIYGVCGNANVYILGQSRPGGTFWYYYFVVCFFKTPIAIMVLIVWSLFLLFSKQRLRTIAHKEAFLLFPVAYFFFQMDLFYKSQTSIRQIIFIFPLLYVCCGILIQHITLPWTKGLLASLCVLYLVSVLSYFGDYVPYTNEFIPDKKMAYRIVGGANLDFGQGKYQLADYLHMHPEVFPVGPQPRPGKQYIAIEEFTDVWNRHRADWIKPFSPVGHIAHCYLIFDIPADQIK
jgi:Dolichyl-phosphate-mannose-protein mannosyltransferase